MAPPRFSVIIPTRDRPATLPHAVRSVLAQSFGDLELIVVDNDSSTPAAAALAGLSDPRLRIVAAPHRLAMHQNWELGLAEAQGGHVMVIGDDDAVMPDGLELADRLLRQQPAELMTWRRHDFKWPNSTLFPGLMTVRIGARAGTWDAHGRLAELYACHPTSTYMTSIYHGLVAAELIERVRNAQDGRYFTDPVCDIESEVLNAFYGRSTVICERPLTMNGHSGASNGGANGTGATVRQAHARFAAEAGLPEAALVPFGWDFPLYMPTMIAGCLERVKARHFPDDDGIRLDLPALLQHLAGTFIVFGPEAFDGLAVRLKRIAQAAGIEPDRLRIPTERSYTMRIVPGVRPEGEGSYAVNLDAGIAGIEAIDAAIRLAQAMLPPLPPAG